MDPLLEPWQNEQTSTAAAPSTKPAVKELMTSTLFLLFKTKLSPALCDMNAWGPMMSVH